MFHFVSVFGQVKNFTNIIEIKPEHENKFKIFISEKKLHEPTLANQIQSN